MPLLDKTPHITRPCTRAIKGWIPPPAAGHSVKSRLTYPNNFVVSSAKLGVVMSVFMFHNTSSETTAQLSLKQPMELHETLNDSPKKVCFWPFKESHPEVSSTSLPFLFPLILKHELSQTPAAWITKLSLHWFHRPTSTHTTPTCNAPSESSFNHPKQSNVWKFRDTYRNLSQAK